MTKYLVCVCGADITALIHKSFGPDITNRQFLACTRMVWRHLMHVVRRERDEYAQQTSMFLL